MTDKTIKNERLVGGNYFKLSYLRKSKLKLDYFLNQFNFDDYWCFKSTRNQKLISYEELLKFEYANYIFFKKEIYNLDYILYWIDYLKNIGGIMFLCKYLPPFNPYKKIKIMNDRKDNKK